jgi:hypothetical protein
MSRLSVFYHGIRLTTEKKNKEKTSVKVVKKCQLGTIQYVDMATFRQVVMTSLMTPVYLAMLEETCAILGQCRYLPSCLTKAFLFS